MSFTPEEILAVPLPDECTSDELLLEWIVPSALQSIYADTPDAYRVTRLAPAMGGCMIWGCYTMNRSAPEWKPNVTPRALVSYLIEQNLHLPKQEVLQITRIPEIEPGDVLVITVDPATPRAHIEHIAANVADAAQASVIVSGVPLDIAAYDGKHLPKLLELTQSAAS